MRDQWIDWMQEKQRHFFYGVTIVVATFFIGFQLFGKFHKPSTTNYLAANLAFEKWLLHGKDFEVVEKAIISHPDLASKFGALIAEKFIVQNQAEKAESFAETVLARVLKQTPEHARFAQGSLLISQGKLSDALANALALTPRLDKNSLLCGFNLFRIASLQRALNDQAQELASLEELERFMESNPNARAILTECFSEGEITLANYISQRKGKVSTQ